MSEKRDALHEGFTIGILSLIIGLASLAYSANVLQTAPTAASVPVWQTGVNPPTQWQSIWEGDGGRTQLWSPYGNAASVFTQSGSLARYVAERASAGMIGVNIGVPVPREPFSFGGWNESKFGSGDITGKSSIEFFTKLKKTTVKWNPESGVNWMS